MNIPFDVRPVGISVDGAGAAETVPTPVGGRRPPQYPARRRRGDGRWYGERVVPCLCACVCVCYRWLERSGVVWPRGTTEGRTMRIGLTRQPR